MKYIQSHRRNRELSALVKIVESEYWTTEDLTPQQQEKFNSLYKYILKLQTAYSVFFILTYLLHSINCLVKGKEFYICNMWFPEYILEYTLTSPYNEIIFLVQFIAVGVVAVGGMALYDVLFITFIACTIIQLQILKYKLRTVGTGVNKNEFKFLAKCIEYHNILLR